MSWRVNGVMYHDRAEAERARQNGFFSRASRFIGGALRTVANFLTGEESENRSTQQSVAEQRQVVAQRQERRSEMNRMQSRLRQEQQRLQQESEQRHQEAMRAAQNNQELMRSLESDFQEHQQQVQDQFDQAQQQLERNIERVEQQIQASEARLQQNIERVEQQAAAERAQLESRLEEKINTVDQRVTDMQERERRKNEYRTEYARSIVAMVQDRLSQHRSLLASMDLKESIGTTESYIRSAEQHIQQQNYEVALSQSETARIELEGSITRAQNEQARLNSYKEMAQTRLSGVQEIVKKEDVNYYFPAQAPALKNELSNLQIKLNDSFQDVRRSEIHMVQFEEELDAIQKQANHLQSQVKDLQQKEEDRKTKIEKYIFPALSELLGPPSEDIVITMEVEGDPKSDLIITYPTMLGGKVRMSFSIDGEHSYDGYGFSSNDECCDIGKQVCEATQSLGAMETPEYDEENRHQPKAKKTRETQPRSL